MVRLAVLDRISWSARIESYEVRPAPSRPFSRLWHGGRIASDGFSDFLHGSYNPSAPYVELGTFDGWTIVRRLGVHAEYKVALSDKCHQAIAVMRMFGDAPGTTVLLSSLVYKLLDDIARKNIRRQAVRDVLAGAMAGIDLDATTVVGALVGTLERGGLAGEFPRQFRDWGEIKTALGVQNGVHERYARVVLDWLLERRIILRGFRPKCPVCGLQKWYPVDRLSDVFRCDGCQEILSPAPVDQAGLRFSYRLNETIANAVDQGALPVLVAAEHLARMGVLGLIPGVVFSTASPPQRSIDADVLAILKGYPILVEAKAAGQRLTTRQAEATVQLARELGCSRVIFSTTGTFEGAEPALVAAEQLACGIQIEAWAASDLFDPHREETGNHSSDVEYLNRLGARLSGNIPEPSWFNDF